MQRKSFRDEECAIARGLERVGEWWSILILREALQGATRFEEFQKALDIAPNMLTRRLRGLVENGILERRRYSETPERFEYVLTPRGEDFRPVILALFFWGSEHFTPEGRSSILVDSQTGREVEPVLIDKISGAAICDPRFRFIPGPAASEAMKARLTGPRRSPMSRAPGGASGKAKRRVAGFKG
jgi:DNA-binding HxlR family transcriptional regulator